MSLVSKPSQTHLTCESTDRILMPAFGTAAIREMFDDMYDIASQLILKWERLVFLIVSIISILTIYAVSVQMWF